MAELKDGEFVMKGTDVDAAVKKPGKLEIGGGDEPQQVNYSFDIKMPITTEQIDESFIRNKMVHMLKDALKRASQNGEYVISMKGVRT